MRINKVSARACTHTHTHNNNNNKTILDTYYNNTILVSFNN